MAYVSTENTVNTMHQFGLLDTGHQTCRIAKTDSTENSPPTTPTSTGPVMPVSAVLTMLGAILL